MYEFINGSSRLINALESCQGDKEKIEALAQCLYYVPEQLEQDIQALSDYYTQSRNKEQ